MILRQKFLYIDQVSSQLFYLNFILGLFRAQVQRDKYVIIEAEISTVLSEPCKLSLLFGQMAQDKVQIFFLTEGRLLGNYQVIFCLVKANIMFSSIEQITVKVIGVFLEKENISLQFGQFVNQFLYFAILVQETKFIERLHFFAIQFWILIQGLLNLVYFINISEHSMVTNHIVEFCGLFLVFLRLKLYLCSLNPKHLLPFSLEVSSAQEFTILYPCLHAKHS